MSVRGSALALAAALGGAALPTGCGDAPATSPVVSRARTITASAVLARISAIADDTLRGRFTPSPELDRVVGYAADAFRSFGLRPAFATGYTQTWPAPGGGDARNVAAVLDRGDPSGPAEYVVFVAHLDHLGTTSTSLRCQAVGADTICNGADDNASGTAGVLELARAFAGLEPPPRRSLVFLLVSGEEEGLLGSAYYVAHPAEAVGQPVAALNLDMISRNAPDTVFVVDFRLSTLGDVVERVVAIHDDLGIRAVPSSGGGSDQVSFENAGVPSLFFFAGLHPDYHRASDEPARVDADKAARITRLAYWTGYEVASAVARPAWTGSLQAAPRLAREAR